MSDPSADQLPLELEVEEEISADAEDLPTDKAAGRVLLRAALSRSDLPAQRLADWLNAEPGTELKTPAFLRGRVAGRACKFGLWLESE